MPIQRTIDLDLKDPAICAFLKGTDTEYRSGSDLRSERVSSGYAFAKDRFIQAEPTADLPLFIERQCEIRSSAGRLMYTTIITDVVMFKLNIGIYAVLSLKPVDIVLKQQAEDTFLNTDMLDVDKAESEIIKSGIELDDYQVDLEFKAEKVSSVGSFDAALRVFIDQIKTQIDKNGDPLYDVKVLEEYKIHCDGTLPQIPDESIIIVDDIEDPIPDIIKREKENNPRCERIEITEHRVGTAFQYPEYKTEWGRRKLRIGRCWTWVWWPTTYSRTTKYVIIAYVVSTPEIKKWFERAIRDCLESSALATGILILITGGMAIPAAATVFITACLQCLESKIEDSADCLKPDLKLISETGDWDKV